MRWWPWRRHQAISGPLEGAFPQVEKADETLTPNMRALRLAMTAADVLLSMGVAANSVASKALDITETYCKRPVHIDISSNLVMLSQLRGIDREPLTLIRPVALRDVNNQTVQEVQRLIYQIDAGEYSLDEAEAKLDAILKSPKRYPWWAVMLGNAGIAGGVSLMFTTDWRVVLIAFIMGVIVDRLMALMARQAMPAFFRQVGAAIAVTLLAAVFAEFGRHGINFFEHINPTLLVVCGIVMLVAGLMIVGALQDAIEEFYITANARILKVGMLTVGIIVGVLIGIYFARKVGYGIVVSANPLSLTAIHMQAIGGGIAAGAYALATQTRLRALIWPTVIGAGALTIWYIARQAGISTVPASGLAAIVVGAVASLLSRFWHTPSAGVIAAGIVPLVPGLALYTAMMQLVQYPPGDPLFARGLGSLFTAIAVALAIAAGASFGSMIGRPLHQKLTHTRNLGPFIGFMRRQLKVDRMYRGLSPTTTRARSSADKNSAE